MRSCRRRRGSLRIAVSQVDPYLAGLLEDSERLAETFPCSVDDAGSRQERYPTSLPWLLLPVAGVLLAVATLCIIYFSGDHRSTGASDLDSGSPSPSEPVGSSSAPLSVRETLTSVVSERFLDQFGRTAAYVEPEPAPWRRQSEEIASLALGQYHGFQRCLDQEEWNDQILEFFLTWRDAMIRTEGKEFTALAYARCEFETIAECQYEYTLVRRRAHRVARWLQRFSGNGYVVHAESHACHLPVDAVEGEAQISGGIVLVQGYRQMKCDCAETLGAP